MEHRFSHRQPVVRQVVLHYRNQCISPCHVSDLGQGGAFVEVSGKSDIPLGALVSLVWEDGQQHVEGLVVHQTSRGIGLMFRDERATNLLGGNK